MAMQKNTNAITIYHNPACGTSRNVLALIRHAKIEPTIISYLQTPPSAEVLRSLIARAGLTPRDVLRKKEAPYKELGLDKTDVSEADIISAMLVHPVLINRPLVDTGDVVRLCRPSDVVLDLLPNLPKVDFFKEDGAPVLRDSLIDGGDVGFVAALQQSALPIDDLNEAGRCFYAYHTLGGTLAGYAGFECYGDDALIRSVVVPEVLRGKAIGRNLVALLLYRAFQAGARRAWLLTISAADYFTKIGFKPVERDVAPQSILSTRQAQGLCPASAKLLCRNIGF